MVVVVQQLLPAPLHSFLSSLLLHSNHSISHNTSCKKTWSPSHSLTPPLSHTLPPSHSPSNGCQQLLDSSLAEELDQHKRTAVRDYKEWRNSVLSLRDEERRHRNMLKHHQVELVEEWQVSNKQIIFVGIKFSNSSKNSFDVSASYN